MIDMHVLVFTYKRLLECSWASLSFTLRVVARLSCLCLFKTIIELHATNEKRSMTFSLESESEFYV